MLNVCDLSTDGCFTLGAAVGATVAISGSPVFIHSCSYGCRCRLRFCNCDPADENGCGQSSCRDHCEYRIVFCEYCSDGRLLPFEYEQDHHYITMMKDALKGTPLQGRTEILVALIAVVIVVAFLVFFLKTRLGLAIRATGNNPDMVKSSSINPVFTTIVGLCVANSFTALSGCLLAQSQKSVDINIGQGMVTIALASLLIGGTILGKGGILLRAVGMVLGAFIFRLVYTIALRLNMPAFMLKLVSSVIVVLAISGPYLKKQWPQIRRRMTHKKGGI